MKTLCKNNTIKLLSIILLILGGNSNAQTWQQKGQDIDGKAAGDQFGRAVSMSNSGTVIAVGAIANSGNGSVRVFEYNGSTWAQKGQDIDGKAAGDYSGCSVSISNNGNIVAIGANRYGNFSGQVRVYEFNGTSWQQKGQDIDCEAAGDASGWSSSISDDGNIVAIGAGNNDGNGDASGSVRVYGFNGSVWQQKGQDIDGEATGDHSGWSVSLSGDGLTVAIGALDNIGNGGSSGHTRVYSFNGSVWQQLGQDIDGEAADDHSGWSVSLSGDGLTVAIGALYNDGNGLNSGHTRVYSFNGSVWQQLGQDIDGEAADDQSGYSVSLSGDGLTVAIGAPSNDGNGDASGSVRVYGFNGSVWQQKGQDIDGEATVDASGGSVFLSSDGKTVIIGAFANDGNGGFSGSVRVYNETLGANLKILSIKELGFIYPNPSKGLFNLKSETAISSIEVYNNIGILVLKPELKSINQIDLSSLSKGLYFLKVSDGKQYHTEKVIIE